MAHNKTFEGHSILKRDRDPFKSFAPDGTEVPDSIQTLTEFVEHQMKRYEILCRKKDTLFRYAGKSGRRADSWRNLQEESVLCLRSVRSALDEQLC